MNKNSSSIWHIAGIGAVGTIIATNFCRANLPVQLILKNEKQLAEYQQSQLTITTDTYNYTCHPQATSASSLHEPIDRLICCTKAYHVSPLLDSLQANLTEESIIILLHNGVGVLDEVRTKWPHLRIISGITTLGGYLEKPYAVQAFLKGSVSLGSTVGNFSKEDIRIVEAAFIQSGLTCVWAEDIQELIWDKFAINCSINILTAVFNCKNGELIKHTKLVQQLTKEIALVLSSYNVPMDAALLFERACKVIENTAQNYSSTFQDVKFKRLTEMDYLNGRLMLLAKQKEIEIPLTEKLLAVFYTRFPIT